jgi:hypothetical protein
MNREQLLEIIKQLTEDCEKTTDLKNNCGYSVLLERSNFYRNRSITSYVEAMLKELAKDDVIPN